MSAVAAGQQKIGNANKSRAPFADSGDTPRARRAGGALYPNVYFCAFANKASIFLKYTSTTWLFPKAQRKKWKQKFDENVDISDVIMMICINGF